VREHQLDGGITNAGQVVRVGAYILRPAGAHAAAIHTFLRALRETGFTGAPQPLGIDPDGRERLEFIPGDVPSVPYPDWAQTDAALASLGRLLREFHDAASTFTASRDLSWNDALSDPAGGEIVCHNDLELSNVVFRNGIAVAFIDFEFAAPGRRVYDLAHLARFCVPLDHDIDRTRVGWQPTEHPRRLRLLADAYGLDDSVRLDLLDAIDDAFDVIESAIRRSVAAGDPNATALWNRTGGGERFDRRRHWWNQHRDECTAALSDS
jgi:Phosphotransferase enzyme family